MIRSNSRNGKPHKNHAFISLADGDKVKVKSVKEKAKQELEPFGFSRSFDFDLAFDLPPLSLAENCIPQGAKSQDVILRDDKPGRRISPTR